VKNPVVDKSVKFGEVATLKIAVKQHLKSKSRPPVTIKLRGDVYRCLFKNKGSFREGWQLLDKAVFTRKYFPISGITVPFRMARGKKYFT